MKKEQKEKTLKDILVETVVQQYKDGKIITANDAIDYVKDLMQPVMQGLLDAELDNHLKYEKYEHSKDKNNNARNGHCKAKKVQTESGIMEVKTPRDRNGSFKPIIIEKGQTKLAGFEEKCLALYAKGMSYRDIENILRELYKVDINKEQIMHLISVVNEQCEKWRMRKLQPMYVFTYADCLYVPIKDNFVSEKKAVYVILGVDVNGYKDILGIWIDKTESANFWTNVFEDLKVRGVKDILYMTSDGIAGFKGSLETVFPKTNAQRCVVHLSRNLYKLAPKKEAKEIIKCFKDIYTCPNIETAQIRFEDFKTKFSKYPKVVEKVDDFMKYLEPLLELPEEIRYAIYTSNAIESVNSALRKVTRGKGSFPSEESVFKVLFLRIRDLKEKWIKPIKNWKTIQEQLIAIHGERYTKHLNI